MLPIIELTAIVDEKSLSDNLLICVAGSDLPGAEISDAHFRSTPETASSGQI